MKENNLGRDERLLALGTQTRAPPRADIPHHSNIPVFHHSIEVIGKPAACEAGINERSNCIAQRHKDTKKRDILIFFVASWLRA